MAEYVINRVKTPKTYEVSYPLFPEPYPRAVDVRATRHFAAGNMWPRSEVRLSPELFNWLEANGPWQLYVRRQDGEEIMFLQLPDDVVATAFVMKWQGNLSKTPQRAVASQ